MHVTREYVTGLECLILVLAHRCLDSLGNLLQYSSVSMPHIQHRSIAALARNIPSTVLHCLRRAFARDPTRDMILVLQPLGRL